MPGITIGKLAEQAAVAIDTVRYYERSGLLPEPARRESGYREYPPETVKRLRFIRRAKALGFSLPEIGELLALSAPRADVRKVKHAAQEKLKLLDEKIAELTRMRAGLQQLVKHCPGHGSADDCPILNALNENVGS
ncbi:heavy metal-responsive transcriptional regulator [Stenotrophobium rhamnosiphilum]|uniref:Heavy metal-responsive transcriptional regulator n=1 Tax=Stenotrophobium rhamnosiphilum TaxID=2029166 RepID=A0A2T5MCW6_9GAMM|nr:heavy metal-responsive transcriptional regulator [Stenotrophobium rhamnosiphilum]PTU30410.1 heavy metal-responsive transcriptional regulator [Stenotrophobium rhamnosiphilum]